jgi:copper chaperone CopZ
MTFHSLVILAALASPAVASAQADTTATTVLAIKGMTCGGCVAAVKLQLRKTDGVTAYEVSYEEAQARVTYDPVKTTPEKIAASVSKTGFEASVRKTGNDAADAAGKGSAPAAPKKDCVGESCQRDCCQRPAAAAQNQEATGLVSLAQSSSQLVSDFNAAKAKPRFLAILSPTCGACVHGAEAIKTAVLPAADSVDVFVVWAPMLEGDGSGTASASAVKMAAPHVRQYWDPERRAGTAFRKDVFPDAVAQMKRSIPKKHFMEPYLVSRDGEQPEWDIYVFFEPGIEWTSQAPSPSRWVRQTALLSGAEGGGPTSVLWANDYSSAPVEGSLTEHLQRLLRPNRRGAVR